MTRISKFLCAVGFSVAGIAWSQEGATTSSDYSVYFNLNGANVFFTDDFESPLSFSLGEVVPLPDALRNVTAEGVSCIDGWNTEPNAPEGNVWDLDPKEFPDLWNGGYEAVVYPVWGSICNTGTITLTIPGSEYRNSLKLVQSYGLPNDQVVEIEHALTNNQLDIPFAMGVTSDFTFKIKQDIITGFMVDQYSVSVTSSAVAANDACTDSKMSVVGDMLHINAIAGCEYKLSITYKEKPKPLYYIQFEHPAENSGLFYVKRENAVGSGWTRAAYFYEEPKDAENPTRFPYVMDKDGCLHGWVPADEDAETQFWEKADTAVYWLRESLAAVLDASASVNRVKVSDRKDSCGSLDNIGNRNNISVSSDGHGSLVFMQEYPNEKGNNDAVPFALEEDGSFVLPRFYNYIVPITVAASPDEDYGLKEMSLEYTLGTNKGKFVNYSDTMRTMVESNQNWKVSFNYIGPRYISYNLGLDSSEMSGLRFEKFKVSLRDTVKFGYSKDLLPPYHMKKAFKGWSLISPEKRVATDPLFTCSNGLEEKNLMEAISTNANAPTELYAVWDERTAEIELQKIAVLESEHVSAMAYQLIDRDTLFISFDENNELFTLDSGSVTQIYAGLKFVADSGYALVEKGSLVYRNDCIDGRSEDDYSDPEEWKALLVDCSASKRDDEGGYFFSGVNTIVVKTEAKPEDPENPEDPNDSKTIVYDVVFDALFTEPDSLKVFYGSDWVERVRYEFGGTDDTTTFSLPATVYTSGAYIVGWSDKKVLSEGDPIYTELDVVSAKALFGDRNKITLFAVWKSEERDFLDKTPVEVVYDSLFASGNAVALKFKTSDFEISRNVNAEILMVDALGVVDTVYSRAIKNAADTISWSRRYIPAGDYKFFVQLSEGKNTIVSKAMDYHVDDRIFAVGKDSWQMISMALVDTSRLSKDDDQIFYWWDETGTPGIYWQYKELKRGAEIEPSLGFWYSSYEGSDLFLDGSRKVFAEDGLTWNLDSSYSGWNLVANPYGWYVSLYDDNQQERRDVNEESKFVFVRYNSKTGDYEIADTLKPYEALWVRVAEPNSSWHLKGEPVYVSGSSDSVHSLNKKILAKAQSKSDWFIQAVLSDHQGKTDSWNVMGVSAEPFVNPEPPAAMGDHVTLSIMDGKRPLAKSFKAESDAYQWELKLAASSNREGELMLAGVSALNSLGYRVYVTIDGISSEMQEGVALKVNLKKSGTSASICVRAGALNRVASGVENLRVVQTSGSMNVTFSVDESLAGEKLVVDVLNMDGKILSSLSGKAVSGVNNLAMDAPEVGLHMLRVRVANKQSAGRIMIK